MGLVVAFEEAAIRKDGQEAVEGLFLTEHAGLWPRGEMDRVG